VKKDIVFLCQYFYPEHNSSATLPYDVASGLAEAGFSVDAICGMAKEYSYAGNVPSKETVNGVNICRIKYLQAKRSKKIGRLINYFSFSLSMMLRLFSLRKYKSIIVYSNPPILPFVAVMANALFKTKIIFVSFDVYPEVALVSGAIKKGSIIEKGMSLINKMLFKRVSKVVALTDEMKEFILEHREEISEENIVTIPNWAHENPPTKNDAQAKKILGYAQTDFIVSYLGNMGICQEMDTLLDAIDELESHKKIKFIFAGHGIKTETVRQRTENNENVRMYGFLQGEDFENVLAASSCCVLSLEKYMKGLGAPSKLYSYLQAGKPVIAITDEDSYLRKDIEENGYGVHVETFDNKKLAEEILRIAENAQIEKCFSECARITHQQNEKNKNVKKYVEMLNSI